MNQSFPDSLLINYPTKVINGINIYDRSDYNSWYENEYDTSTEPWEYSHRGAELYRHIYSLQKIKQYCVAPKTVLELGCSKGLMTELLISFSRSIYAADVSLTALKACRQRCNAKAEKNNCQINYFLTTTPGLPFAASSFDVVTLCDGLAEWNLSEEQKLFAVKDIYRVLKKGGIAIFTDCLMPELNKGEFESYEIFIRNSPLLILETSFLYDKPWYKLESLLKKTRLANTCRTLLSSISIAKVLNSVGRLVGRKASRHIVIIVRKDG